MNGQGPVKSAGQDVRRWIVLVLAVLMLGTAAVLYFTAWAATASLFWLGVLVRLGTLLMTLFLAWPVLSRIRHRLPALAMAIGLGLLLLLVVRPRVVPLAAGLAVAGIIVHFGLRLTSGGKK